MMQVLLVLVLVCYVRASLVFSKETSITSSQLPLTQSNLSNVPVTDLSFQNAFLRGSANQFKITNDNITTASVTQPNLINLWKRFPLSITANVSGLSERCQRSTREFLKGVQDQELWALKMLDATAKLPSGILSGNVNQFGDFDECLSVQKAQYCLAEIDLEPVWKKSHASYKDLVHSHFSFRGTFSDPQHRIPDFAIIKWGICMPSECSPVDLQRSLEEKLEVVARVQPSLCKKSAEPASPWTFGDYFARLFFALLLLAVTTSTLVVHHKVPFFSSSESKWVKIVLAFSIQNNWRELVNTDDKTSNSKEVKDVNNNNSNNGKDKPIESNIGHREIRAVHGIRALSAIGLLMCHKSIALLYNPYINRTVTAENIGMAWTVIARTAIVYTDSFMLLSGLLTANSLLKDIDRHGSLKFKDKLITRLFRITPNIVALILFCTYILPNISSGPLWPMVVQEHSNLCKQHMWRNFLYIHNHFGFENMCLTHTHQVGIDMQLFLFTPVLIYLWWINKKLGVYSAGIIAVLSTILRYWVTIRHNLSHMIYFGIPAKQMFDTANLSYVLPTHRATIYVTGVLLAYILKRYNSLFLSKLQATLWWIAALSFGAFSMIGPFHMARLGYVYNSTDAAIFGAFSPVWWGVCLSWVIFASNNGYAGWFGDFLSWKGFQQFTKIAYAFYLVQFPVIFYNIGVQKNADEFRPNVLLHYSETSVIILLSVILTLCVEMPFQKIKNILFDASQKCQIRQSNIYKTTKTGHIKRN